MESSILNSEREASTDATAHIKQMALQLHDDSSWVNAKTCLQALRTQFKEFLASKGVNATDLLNQGWQQDFEDFTRCEPSAYRRELLENLDTLEAVIHRVVNTYGVLRMKENEVNALKENGSQLHDEILHEHQIKSSVKMQSQDIQINPVQAMDDNELSKSSLIKPENNNAFSKSEIETQMQRQEQKADMREAVISGPVNDEESFVRYNWPALHNSANEQQHTEQSEPIMTTHLLETLIAISLAYFLQILQSAAAKPLQVEFSCYSSVPQDQNNNHVEQKNYTHKPGSRLVLQRFSLNKSSAVHEKPHTPRSCLRWKPTGRIFKTVSLRWIPTGKMFTDSTTKVDSEPPNGSNDDITNPYECNQTLYEFKEFKSDEHASNDVWTKQFKPRSSSNDVWTKQFKPRSSSNDVWTKQFKPRLVLHLDVVWTKQFKPRSSSKDVWTKQFRPRSSS
ncbi:hypothetical protein Tco_1440462 [Tanacetum coccineum]